MQHYFQNLKNNKTYLSFVNLICVKVIYENYNRKQFHFRFVDQRIDRGIFGKLLNFID